MTDPAPGDNKETPAGTVARGTSESPPAQSEAVGQASAPVLDRAADQPTQPAATAPQLPRSVVEPPPRPPELEEEAVMSLVDHLTELRNRLLTSLIAVGVATLLCLVVAQWLIDWLKAAAPAHVKFYTTNPTEVFTVYVKTAAISGLVLAMPVIFYQLWEFIRPGLRRTEREYTRLFVPAFTLSFFGGALFARYVIVPIGVSFLIDFAQGIAEPLYTVGDYTSFVLELMLMSGLLFEFPIILYLMGTLGLVNSELLRRKRRVVIFWIFIISAGVTPSTDAGTQIAMAAPIVMLYELSILVMRLRGM